MKNSTAIVYDELFLKHDQPGHPEHAERLKSIIEELKLVNLWDKLIHLKTRLASSEELCLSHSADYVNYLREFCEKGGGYLDPDTYANKFSFEAASLAVGSLVDLTKAVISGEVKNGFALVRPPGHHALSNRSMGFCLLGNISITAKWSSEQSAIKKPAIVDFDVHHGNGTQSMVESDPNILFISSHQYPFYPGTGSIREIGKGDAEGTLINIPLPPGVGDNGFKMIYEGIIIPSLQRFKPDIILVSAGYDAHWDDPLANMGLTLGGFAWISNELVRTARELCNSKIVFTLEGGYNLKALASGVSNSIRALMGDTFFSDPLGPSPIDEPDISNLVKELKRIHQL